MILDRHTLDLLRALSTSPEDDVLRDVATLFVSQAPSRLAAIRSSVEANEPDALKRAAHSLKGSAATLGAKRLSGLAAEIERLAGRGCGDRLRVFLPFLEAESAAVCKALVSEAICTSGDVEIDFHAIDAVAGARQEG